MVKNTNISNAVSIDLEEYFHAENIAHQASKLNLPSRAEYSLERTLEVLNRNQTQATFFVLGKVAKEHPSLIKKIYTAGHEIASHGMNHQLVYRQSISEFTADISDSKKLLEDFCSAQVYGYRAPNFSIINRHQEYRQIIAETGYTYDSSLYPVWHPRYANAEAERFPFESAGLTVVPLSTMRIFGYNLPVAGGAYWRLLPKIYNQTGLDRVINREQQGLFTYFHPWELDTQQPVINEAPYLTRLRHYGGIKSFARKLDYFLNRYKFTTYQKALKTEI